MSVEDIVIGETKNRKIPVRRTTPTEVDERELLPTEPTYDGQLQKKETKTKHLMYSEHYFDVPLV
jgi:hypothetical protein